MDIVSRLKKFITHEGVAVTQFADNCKIPRPTLSQLLNGRNKKVSDELITKIHEAYPMLSVLWLMFGEGDMIIGKNIEPTEASQNLLWEDDKLDYIPTESNAPRIDFEKNFSDSSQPNLHESSLGISGLNSTNIDVNDDATPLDSIAAATTAKPSITFNPYSKRKIVNIIVYYDDNSFESFIPGRRK